MEWLSDPQAWTALLTLTVLEIVLGVDNIIFISTLSDRLPVAQRARARTVGLLAAMFMHIALLFSIGWIIGLTRPLISVAGRDFTGRDLILIGGGLFLLLLGMVLVAEGFGQHIPQGYVYFAMAFAVFIELLNMRPRRKTEPVKLHQQLINEDFAAPSGGWQARTVS